MALHNLPPSLPVEWKAAFKLPSADGMYESWIVIHPSNSSYHPLVVHKAFYYDEGESKGKFAYEHGTYCKDMPEAEKAFKERIKGWL